MDTDTDEDDGHTIYTITGPNIKAGDNVTVDSTTANDGKANYTISATNYSISSMTYSDNTLTVTQSDETTKKVTIKSSGGGGGGSGTEYEAGDGITISDDTISARVGDGIEISDGKITASVGDGITISDGKIVNDLTINEGDNVTVDVSATEGYTISAKDTTLDSFVLDGMELTVKDTAGNEETGNLMSLVTGGVEIEGGDNIDVTTEGSTITVALKDAITVNSVKADTVTATTVTADTVKTGDVSMSSSGINAGSQKITNVAAGTADTDAVNVAQLKQVSSGMSDLDSRISRTDRRARKGIAGAAALAALHPAGFEADDKWSVAAGMANYRGQTAGAIGAFFRPTDRILMNMGASVGNDENIVNFGVSFALDKSPYAGTGKVAMKHQINSLSDEVKTLKADNAAKDKKIADLTDLVEKMNERLAKLEGTK